MYLVRSGLVDLQYHSLRHAGHRGRLWSSTTGTDSSHAYLLDFSNSTIYPANYYVRLYGFPVRCIAE